MADASEDMLSTAETTQPIRTSSSSSSVSPSTNAAPPNDPDAAEDDSAPDFRFLSTVTATTAVQQKIPSRGVKDFEPHGTRLQLSALEASRQAMHDVLMEERLHPPAASGGGGTERAVWCAEPNGAWCAGSGAGKWAMTVGVVKWRAKVGEEEDKDEEDAE